MKKLLLLGLATLVFVACQNKPQRYFDESAEIETLKAGIKAYENQDWSTWKSHFADTAKIFHNSNNPASPSEMAENMEKTLSYFSSYGFSKEGGIHEMVIDKDGKTWVNYWGNWGGKANVTGKQLVVPVHLTLQFVDGKIVQEYAYYDTGKITSTIQEIEAAKMVADTTSTTSTN